MKKSYKSVLVIMATIAFMLTGCGAGIPDLSPAEEVMIGEYAANLLLKYDANHRSRLVSREEVAEEELKEQQRQELVNSIPTQEGMGPVDDTPVIEVGQGTGSIVFGDMESFFELPEGIKVSYKEKEVCDSYPQGESATDYFVLDATEGKKLLILKFEILNQASNKQEMDFLSKDAIINVTINGSYSRNVLTTMLMNDMSTYRGEISAGEGIELVLVTEVDADVANNISSMVVKLKNDSTTSTIQLQ